MKDEDKWHEPQTVKDAKNAVGFYAVEGIVAVIIIAMLGGLVAPLFWKKWKKISEEMAQETAAKTKKPGTYEHELLVLRIYGTIIFIIWFFGSWAFLLACLFGPGPYSIR